MEDCGACPLLNTSLLVEWKSEVVVNQEVEVAQISPGFVSTHSQRHVQEN